MTVKVPGTGRVKRAARWLANGFAPGVLVLMYHRVVELASDPWLLCVTPGHFAEHLQVLAEYAPPMHLKDLERDLLDRRLPRRAVVVTFDDGYADNLSSAKPILEQQDTPATVFATSGYVGGEQEFWWDQLEAMLLQPAIVPSILQISVNGHLYEWSLGGAAHYAESDFSQHRGWNIEHSNDPTERQRVCRSIHQLVKPLTEAKRQHVLQQLRIWAGGSAASRPSHALLRVDELARLANTGLVEIGAHSVSHPMLPELHPAEQQKEIEKSKRDLETVLDKPVMRFAYPYGSCSALTVSLVRQAGFRSACSNRGGAVWTGSDLLQLPRVQVPDLDGDAFARWLRGHFLSLI